MSVALASTWHPRGELGRLKQHLQTLTQVYGWVRIALPPACQPELVEELDRLPVRYCVTPYWAWGRHIALDLGLETPADHLHYADLDRLLRWVETRPEEWRECVIRIEQGDCLLMGRTRQAYDSHPQSMLLTEAISNRVASYFLGREVDVSAGSKGFSRKAAQLLARTCRPGKPMGTDAEWLMRVRRAGYQIDYVEVDGLDWEIADQHQSEAADPERQRLAAETYDRDPAHWKRRVAVALEIVEAALMAASEAQGEQDLR